MAIDVARSSDEGVDGPSDRLRRRLCAAAICAAIVIAGWVATVPAALAASTAVTAPTSTSVTTENACGPPAPGAVRCLAIERTDIAPMAAGPNVTPRGFGPADLQSAYKLPSATAGGGQTVAIVVAYDDPNVESDLAVYRAQFGLAACTSANGCFRKVNQNGLTSPLPPTNNEWAAETSLDIDMVSAVCPNCHILLVESNWSDSSLFIAANTAVTLGAKFVSMSFGSFDEYNSEKVQDKYLNHPGVVMTASSGDSGVTRTYPSASPYVISVGGTSLKPATNTRGWSETAWNRGGSGCSPVEPAPAYQKGLSSCTGRASTDLSAVADPSTGVAVYQSGGPHGTGWAVYGGTSASSPIMASVYALAGSRPTGDIAGADLYAAHSQLNDVVSGTNGTCPITIICTAGPGWDGPTGFGTPNGIGSLKFPGGSNGSVVTVTNPGNQTTVAGRSATLAIHATDSAGKALIYQATNLPTGLTINATTGLISGTATQVAISNATVTAIDANGSAQSATFVWTVAPEPAGTVKITNPGDQSTNLTSGGVTLWLTATNASGAPLTYSATGLPDGLKLNSKTGLINSYPTKAGVFPVTVTAADTFGGTASANFTWTVRGAAGPATVVVSNPGAQVSVVNSRVRLQMIGTDSAGLALKYYATWLPAGLTLNSVTGLITGSPSTAVSAKVTVIASDVSGVSGSAVFSWTVTGGTTTPPPPPVKVTVSNPGSQSTVVNSAVRVQLTGTDSAGSVLTFRASGLPVGVAINATTGLISGTPTAVGSYPVSVSASDASGASASAGFTWTVTKAPGGGMVSVASYRLTSTTLSAGQTITLSVPYGKGGLPAKGGVSALQLNVALSSTQKTGTIYIWPQPSAGPTTPPVLTYSAGQSPQTTVKVAVGSGLISVQNTGPGTTSIAIYVTGYYTA